jgi:hypothetical protein
MAKKIITIAAAVATVALLPISPAEAKSSHPGRYGHHPCTYWSHGTKHRVKSCNQRRHECQYRGSDGKVRRAKFCDRKPPALQPVTIIVTPTPATVTVDVDQSQTQSQEQTQPPATQPAPCNCDEPKQQHDHGKHEHGHGCSEGGKRSH